MTLLALQFHSHAPASPSQGGKPEGHEDSGGGGRHVQVPQMIQKLQ